MSCVSWYVKIPLILDALGYLDVLKPFGHPLESAAVRTCRKEISLKKNGSAGPWG